MNSEISNPVFEASPSARSDLTDRQLAALDMLLTGASYTAVSTALHIDPKTLYRWRTTDSLFRQTLDQRRRDLFEDTADRFRVNLSSALDVLERQLQDPYVPTSFRAARATLALAQIGKLLHAKPESSHPNPAPHPSMFDVQSSMFDVPAAPPRTQGAPAPLDIPQCPDKNAPSEPAGAVSTSLPTEVPMQVLMNTGGVASTNCCLIADEVAKVAVLFDAPDHTASPLLDEAQKRGWTVTGLWLTHGHFDHLADHAEVTRRFPDAKLLIHKLDEPKLQHPDLQTRLFGLPFTIPARSADAHVADGQRLRIGSIDVQVIHTPGHSPGSVVYYIPQEKLLIGGDLIIGGSVGRTDLPDSDPEQLQASIRKVMQLPPETTLLGGHGAVTTLANERRDNSFVQQALTPSE